MKLIWHMPTLRRTNCGLSRRALRLAQTLRALQYNITFAVARHKAEPGMSVLEDFPVALLDIPQPTPWHWSLQALGRLRAARAAARHIARLPHDVLISCQPEMITACRAMRGAAHPLVYVCGGTTLLHDGADALRLGDDASAARRFAHAVDRRLKHRAERSAFRGADICVFDSDSTRRRVIDGYAIAAAKCHTLHGAVDLNEFAPPDAIRRREARRALGVGDGDFAVAWTGRLSVEKNLPALIRAIHLARAPRARLFIAGDGPETENLNRLSAALSGSSRPRAHVEGALSNKGAIPAGDRVRFLGCLDDVRVLLHAADAFVFPSVSESLGLSLVEALACGVSSIALAPDEAGGIRNASVEVLDGGRCGLLVPHNEPADFAAAIDQLAEDAALRAKLAHAARSAAARYDWTRAGYAMHSLISSRICRSTNFAMQRDPAVATARACP